MYPLPLVGAALDDRDQLDYVKIQMVSKSHYDEIHVLPEGINAFCEKHIEMDAAVSYTERTRTKRRDLKGYPIFKLARAWMKWTYHGLGQAHLQHYWNEFCWRFNTELRNHPLFDLMLKLCAETSTTAYAQLVKQA